MATGNSLLRLLHVRPQWTQMYRLLSTCGVKMVPLLSTNYGADDKWLARLETELLRKVEPNKYFSDLLNRLNNGASLFATDLDIFVNVARPGEHLEECVYLIRQLRRSSKANTVLPSTHHAICRLFIDSDRLAALVTMLEARVTYGLFPDSYAINLILDSAIDKQLYPLAARVVSTVMLQEEFGLNAITDQLAFYSLIKYIGMDKDFNDWTDTGGSIGLDEILGGIADQSSSVTQKKIDDTKEEEDKKEEEQNNDDDEEEYEYVRVPFLRNEYFDNHFDLKEPRQLFGKSLAALGRHIKDDICNKNAQLLGNVIFGSLEKATDVLESMNKQSIQLAADTLDRCRYYVDNLHTLDAPSEPLKNQFVAMLDKVDKTQISERSLENLADDMAARIKEMDDSQQLVKMMDEWTNERSLRIKSQMDNILKLKRIQEIKQKKKELEDKEKYLYFYDNLNRKKVDRIRYE